MSGNGSEAPGNALQTFINALNLSRDEAESLVNAGYRSPGELADISVSKLQKIGMDKRRAEEIKLLAHLIKKSEDSDDRPEVERSEEESEGETDALKKWLSGSDDALMDWLGVQDEPAAESGEAGEAAPAPGSSGELDALKKELEDMRSALQAKIAAVGEKGDIDPLALIEENAQLHMHLQSEIRKRKDLEREIESIKAGSMSAIKYVKGQKLKVTDDRVRTLQHDLAQAQAKTRKLEETLKAKEETLTSLRETILKKISSKPDVEELKKKEMALVESEGQLKEKEKMLALKEEELREREVKLTGPGPADEMLRKRFEDELEMKTAEWKKREADFKKTIVRLEEEAQKLRIELKLRSEYEGLKSRPSDEVDSALQRKKAEMIEKEKSIALREAEINRLREELEAKEEELKGLREPVKFKEEELARREQDLTYRENLLQAEKKKLEAVKVESSSLQEHEMKRRLEDLEREIARKEHIVREKEKFLRIKEQELQKRAESLVESELEYREQEIKVEMEAEKVKTGTPRLDDLMFGGLPVGSAVLVHGPPFSGKDVLAYSFIGEGIEKGIPCIVVLTDMTPSQFKEEMMFLKPHFEAYESHGLVRYVDVYSPTLGEYTESDHTTYIDNIEDTDTLMKSVDAVARDLKGENKPYYRLVFKSISTLISYMDTKAVFRFLQPFVGRRKNERCVALYLIEKGMHSDSEIQMLGAIMDGEIDIKIDQLKTFLRVNGVCDVQSRSFIEYTFSKTGVMLKSFSLGHIR